MTEILRYWGGDERGSDYAEPARRLSGLRARGDPCVLTRSAWRLPSSCRRQPRVAVCVVGDGATSKGDVYEAMNLAGCLAATRRLRGQQQRLGHLGAARQADARARPWRRRRSRRALRDTRSTVTT